MFNLSLRFSSFNSRNIKIMCFCLLHAHCTLLQIDSSFLLQKIFSHFKFRWNYLAFVFKKNISNCAIVKDKRNSCVNRVHRLEQLQHIFLTNVWISFCWLLNANVVLSTGSTICECRERKKLNGLANNKQKEKCSTKHNPKASAGRLSNENRSAGKRIQAKKIHFLVLVN